MFFKGWGHRLLICGTACVLALTASSCSRGSLPSSTGAGLGGADTGCLDHSAATASRYLDGHATEAETGEMWNCAIHSLQLFSDRTRGETAGVFTPGELRAFLQKYFLTGHPISDSLLREGMEFKRALLGGKVEFLTLGELARARSLFATLREQTLLLRPYMPLNLGALSTRSVVESEAISAALLKAADVVGAQLESTGSPYSFAHLDSLLQEIGALSSHVEPRIVSIRGHMAMIQSIKSTLIAPAADRISGDEWSEVLTAGARWFGLLLRFQAHSSHDASLMLAPGRDHALTLVREAFDLLEESMGRHPRGQITFEEIDTLLDATFPSGFEPFPGRPVKVEHLKTFLRPLVQRLMGGKEIGRNGRAAAGLTVPILENTWRSIVHWSEGQRYLEALFAAAGRNVHRETVDPMGFVAKDLSGFSLLGLFSLPTSSSVSPVLADAASHLQRIIQEDRPLFLGDDERITFAGFRSDRRHSLHNLTQMNWMYELARTLMRGYAEDVSRASETDDHKLKVTFAEFKSFCDDLRDLGVDIKFLDPLDDKLAEKRFREAELFTYAGDGGDFLTVQQASQLLAMMYAGKHTANQLHKEISEGPCKSKLGALDPFGYVTIDAQCYRDAFFGDHPRYWKFMPKLLEYYEGLNASQREEFVHTMELGARKLGYSNLMMNSSDSEGYAMLSQYIEVIFARYDQRDSGALSQDDAELAFPVFSGELEKMSCLKGHCLHDPLDLKTVFKFMLSHGEAPTTGQFVNWRYFSWLPFNARWSDADRGRILHIFAAIVSGP